MASDSTLYLYTSLTAGSSHIITATSRLETILKANKIPFRAIDIATDDAARRLWGRYSKGRKLPGLVKFRTIVGDLEQIEEWNEYGELKGEIGAVTDPSDFSAPAEKEKEKPVETAAPKPAAASTTAPTPKSTTPHVQIQNPPVSETSEDQRSLALRLAGEEAAAKAKDNARSKLGAKPATTEADGKAPPTSNPKAKGTETIPETAGKAVTTTTETSTPAATDDKQEDDKKTQHHSPSPARRSSVAPEIVQPTKRPSLADETAAVSSANFHADNVEELGLIDHHRGSIISATTEDEQAKVRNDIRASVSEAPADGDIGALRQAAAEKESKGAAAIEEEEEEPEKPEEQKKTDNLDESKAGVSVED